MESLPPLRAGWIGPAYDPKQDAGVFRFRLNVQLDAVPSTFPVWISADQRYRLHVNGRLVHRGPARGDARHWVADPLDLAAWLRAGENELIATVWNFGWMAPMAQHSVRTAFFLAAPEPFASWSTPGEWQVARDASRDFAMQSDASGEFYIDVGPGEILLPDCELRWAEPHRIADAQWRGSGGGGVPWALVPRRIPLLHDAPLDELPWSQHLPPEAVTAHRFDAGRLVVAYPRWTLANPNEAPVEVRLTYAEAPVDASGNKGHRGETEGKAIRGYQDRIVLEPGRRATFEPLWVRTFRYVEFRADAPIHIEAASAAEWRYPYAHGSTFEAGPPYDELWAVSRRTLELCAGETYFDCPYYEQLQYVGDTRIQALCGYFLSRDRALQRQAIAQVGWSLMENGLTQSRYPSRQMQVIPPFSLWWVVMLFDAWRYDDPAIARPWLDAATRVVEVTGAAIERGEETFWWFGDWVPGWRWGVPPGGPEAPMHRLTWMLASACLAAMRDPDFRFEWPMSRPAFVGAGGTEHEQALWRYGQVLAGHSPDAWPDGQLEATCTEYFRYYRLAADRTGLDAAAYAPWVRQLELGLSTFAETPEPTRSDCHAWSAHPALHFLRNVAGIDSAGPGWSAARIDPNLAAPFRSLVAHPMGDIAVAFDGLELDVQAPIPFLFRSEGPYEPGHYRFCDFPVPGAQAP